MSQFLVLIYESEAQWESADKPTFDRIMGEHMEFGQKYSAAVKGGEALQPTPTAKTIRNDTVTDGPFLETKEALGGYYLIEAADMDEAVEVARHVPANFGCVEVRPIMVFT